MTTYFFQFNIITIFSISKTTQQNLGQLVPPPDVWDKLACDCFFLYLKLTILIMSKGDMIKMDQD